jgi:hypothetical protein
MQLKPGGRIPEKGKKITLHVKNIKDLSRDVIKVCYLLYPDFDKSQVPTQSVCSLYYIFSDQVLDLLSITFLIQI